MAGVSCVNKITDERTRQSWFISMKTRDSAKEKRKERERLRVYVGACVYMCLRMSAHVHVWFCLIRIKPQRR